MLFSQVIKKQMLHTVRKHEVIDQGKFKKGQLNESGKKGRMILGIMLVFFTNVLRCFLIKKQFPSFPFFGTHTKPHCVRGLSKN